MNVTWQAYLQQQGAVVHDGYPVDFGDAADELKSAGSGTVLADLSHLGLIRFSGEDAQIFLQGQLSCDVGEIDTTHAHYGSYCNPKGRILASFLLWNDGDSYLMQLPSELQAAIQKRLSMFVMRAKVSLTDHSAGLIRLGVAGNRAEILLTEIMGAMPAHDLSVIHTDHGTVIRLGLDRFEIITLPEKASSLWERLSKDAKPVGMNCWSWLDIKAGIPVIMTATQEQFIPQMVNLQSIGGVSFQKGCYPGQEIVARTQYLGKIKRHMYLASIRSSIPVSAGDELFSADMADQSSGMVVNAAPSPEGGFDLMAVIQTSSAEAGLIHWQSLEGPTLEMMPLPYSV